MRDRINRIVLFLGLFFVVVGAALYFYESNPQVYNTLARAGLDVGLLDSLGKWEGEMADGKYFVFEDENGREIDQTVHEVFIGDEVILENNNRYKVVSVDNKNNRASCELVGRESINWREEWDQPAVMEVALSTKKVGIYMTHSDESYVPSEGSESKPGRGGIMDVGSTLARKLKENGIDAQISYNRHEPHDANAYHRSRRTAVQLLKTNPLALIDVHRDGVPDPNHYKTVVKGEQAAKVRLVVGRQNPHMSANLEFAKQLKAYFDKKYPGLIKGIFIAKGNYNQDLGPRAILIEVGTHTNSKNDAENGAALFADGLPQVLGAVGPGVQGPAAGPVRTGAGRALLWLAVFVIIGGGAFLLISTGSIKGSLEKLSGLGREFSNYLGPQRIKRKNDKE
ncbi:MAG: stage II sporulation protein P [Peptococcaceae bacterium]|jgi:stage II sporulation protein P|nr:stage II sporulation protein P [Peptococcaceae bacterium]MDH7525233.1 stage II sporulation protein P [Peptococcaceae bacterium]